LIVSFTILILPPLISSNASTLFGSLNPQEYFCVRHMRAL
jgi:hypothetical protein